MEEVELLGNNIFTTQSLNNMLDEYYSSYTKPTAPPTDVTWDGPTLVYDASSTVDADKLYSIHSTHLYKLDLLASKLSDLMSQLNADDLLITYLNTTIGLQLHLKYNATSILTTDGMKHCNDIYNWYESVKRTS